MIWILLHGMTAKKLLQNISVNVHIFPASFPSLPTMRIASCKRIQDSPGFWIPSRGFRIPGTGFRILCQWIQPFVMPVSLSSIPDCISKSFPRWSFYKQRRPWFRVSLHGVTEQRLFITFSLVYPMMCHYIKLLTYYSDPFQFFLS